MHITTYFSFCCLGQWWHRSGRRRIVLCWGYVQFSGCQLVYAIVVLFHGSWTNHHVVLPGKAWDVALFIVMLLFELSLIFTLIFLHASFPRLNILQSLVTPWVIILFQLVFFPCVWLTNLFLLISPRLSFRTFKLFRAPFEPILAVLWIYTLSRGNGLQTQRSRHSNLTPQHDTSVLLVYRCRRQTWQMEPWKEKGFFLQW